ncbi:hypothetical protein FF021_12830 [Leptospira noguchii]|nr:hypothetical protein FF021_12830 [Leptospira noguchii]
MIKLTVLNFLEISKANKTTLLLIFIKLNILNFHYKLLFEYKTFPFYYSIELLKNEFSIYFCFMEMIN